MISLVRIGVGGFCVLLLAACGQPSLSPQASEEQPFEVVTAPSDDAPVRAPVPVPPPDTRGKNVDPKDIRANIRPVKRLTPGAKDRAYEQRHQQLTALAAAHEMYFAPDSEHNLLEHGSFEAKWDASARYPEGWGEFGAFAPPGMRRAEGYGKVGDTALRILGSADQDVGMRTLELPPLDRLRGKEVVFGMWIKTPWPRNTFVQVVESSAVTSAQPTLNNKWQLVLVKTRVPEDSTDLHCGIVLKRGAGVDALIDGAAFTVIE